MGRGSGMTWRSLRWSGTRYWTCLPLALAEAELEERGMHVNELVDVIPRCHLVWWGWLHIYWLQLMGSRELPASWATWLGGERPEGTRGSHV